VTPEERRERLSQRTERWRQDEPVAVPAPAMDKHLLDQELAKLLAMPGWERVKAILSTHTQVRLGEIADPNWALKVAEDKGKASLAIQILVMVEGAPGRLEKWKAKQDAEVSA